MVPVPISIALLELARNENVTNIQPRPASGTHKVAAGNKKVSYLAKLPVTQQYWALHIIVVLSVTL